MLKLWKNLLLATYIYVIVNWCIHHSVTYRIFLIAKLLWANRKATITQTITHYNQAEEHLWMNNTLIWEIQGQSHQVLTQIHRYINYIGKSMYWMHNVLNIWYILIIATGGGEQLCLPFCKAPTGHCKNPQYAPLSLSHYIQCFEPPLCLCSMAESRDDTTTKRSKAVMVKLLSQTYQTHLWWNWNSLLNVKEKIDWELI